MALSATIKIYDTVIGAVAWDVERGLGVFEYAEDFLSSGLELAPIQMPLRAGAFAFPGLPEETFKGLPGLLADALPDKFGNLLIDQWLARQNRLPESFNPVERLCYLGSRAMGALEFEPETLETRAPQSLEIAALVELANDILAERLSMETRMIEDHEEDALADILRVGTSAGGARAKAVIAWHPETGSIQSGQVPLEAGYEPWLLKFDGVDGNADKELADPLGYGRIEYAYHLMALEAGITMTPCRLLEESGRAHFMTRRFDRAADGGKIHLQTLCALGHYDFNQPGGYSYEQAFLMARQIGCERADLEELYRRAIFNLLTRNQDDHTKNLSFMMTRRGVWRLAPAYDVTYAYNPSGAWTGQHQMSLNGKRDGFSQADFLEAARAADVKPRLARQIESEIRGAMERWPRFGEEAGVEKARVEAIRATFR